MENTLRVIELVMALFTVINFVVLFLWLKELKKNSDGILYPVVVLGLMIVQFALEIPIVIIKVLLEERYWLEVWQLAILVATIICFTLLISYQIMKRTVSIGEEESENRWTTKKENISFPRKRFLFFSKKILRVYFIGTNEKQKNIIY